MVYFKEDPTVKASSTCSLKNIYNKTVGILAIVMEAPIAPQFVVNCPWKNNNPKGKVFKDSLDINTKAIGNSFQADKKVNITKVAIAGFITGIITLQKVL